MASFPSAPADGMWTGRVGVALTSLTLVGCAPAEPEWLPLFNGRDLAGWTPKIAGQPLGSDAAGTFRVEDGLLTVGYEGYDDFADQFGHLFYEQRFSRYRLLVEYRFVGEQARGGPDWAFKNSGVMFHSQSPGSMLDDQDFPISLEAQLLGGNGVEDRPTANVCTPGTHIQIDGDLVEQHCVESSSPTFHGEEWVTFELLALGDSLILHMVNGDTVMAYERPVIGGGVVSDFDPEVKADGTPLEGGHIALQSESHPIQFRRVLLQPLD